MLPSTPEGRACYLGARESRNFGRKATMHRLGGDLDAFAADQRAALASDLELDFVREQADFMAAEGMITPEVQEGLDALFSWATELQARLGGLR